MGYLGEHFTYAFDVIANVLVCLLLLGGVVYKHLLGLVGLFYFLAHLLSSCSVYY